MTSANYQFHQVLGNVYHGGNVLFTGDGNTVVSPVGNRVAAFDLVNNKSRTFPFQNRRNIARIALSPDSNVLISVDEDGRALLANFRSATVLHHFNFRKPVRDLKFSPDGRYILASHGSHAQVWQTPSHLAREFAPFVKHREYVGHHDDVISVTWSPDSRYFLTTSKDMTAKLYTLHAIPDYRPLTFAGHREACVNAYFSPDQKTIYTIGKDGVLYMWGPKALENGTPDSASSDEDAVMDDGRDDPDNATVRTRWGIVSKHFFSQSSKVETTAFHASASLLVVGFVSGVFGLYELSPPDGFVLLHTLSISQERVTSVAINPSGEWLAFGASKLGQLLVWEWQSESYVLKQQGHYADTNALAFSPDGQHVATGGEDGKVKLWNATSAFCFVTFSEHSSAITAVEFTKQGQVIYSASLDGTVRAFDLSRYRNFRTFHAPTPVQFTALAVDPSGEIVCAAGTSADSFDLYVWSTQTGKLIEVLAGHQGPISGLAFSPQGDRVASSSWDQTVRIWELYGRSHHVEPLSLASDALAVAYRPDGKQIAVSTLNGQIAFFEAEEGRQVGLIEGARDIQAGKTRSGAARGAGGKAFTSLAYSADGARILAGGASRWVCLFDISEGVLLKRWALSENLDLEGTVDHFDTRTRDLDEVDATGDLSDLEDRHPRGGVLPGASRNVDLSKRRHRAEVRANCVRLAPTGRAWAAAGTEGVQIYSLDAPTAAIAFDPFDLAEDVTPQAVAAAIKAAEPVRALAIALRLGERPFIRAAYESVPLRSIRLVCKSLPTRYAAPLLRYIAEQLEWGTSRYFELHLRWAGALLSQHGMELKRQGVEAAAVLRSLQKGLSETQSHIARLSDDNSHLIDYILQQGGRRS